MSEHILVYDTKLRRPACVLLQVAMGGTVGASDIEGMGDWLTTITSDMKPYRVTDEELSALRYPRLVSARRCKA